MALTKASYSMVTGAPINVKDFGAKGNNSNDDTAAIQAAIDAASVNPFQRGAVYFPDGYYVITASLQIPPFISMFGNTTTGCIINNQDYILNAPQCVAKNNQNMIGLQVKNMTFRGGQTAFLFAAGMQSCIFENVNMDLQTDFNINTTDFEINKFINCIFADAQYGMFSGGVGFANLNDFINCEFNTIERSCIYFFPNGGSSVNNFIGCRFENGGTTGRSTIDMGNGTTNANFIGCYFEGSSSNLLGEIGSSNSTVFDGCHFTFGNAGQAYTFVSDGIVNFGTNNWFIDSAGPETMFINGVNNTKLGANNNLYFAHSNQHKKFVSKYISTPATLQRNLLSFDRTNSTGALTNMQALTGVLTVNYYSLDSVGNDVYYSRIIHVFVNTNGFSVMGSQLNSISAINFPRGSTLTIQQKAGATTNKLILEAVFTGLTPATEIQSVFDWQFEYIEASTFKPDTIEVTIA